MIDKIETEIDMQSLVGKRLLSGVDESEISVKQYGDRFENCQCINFILDGVTYTAIENPDDGYRSSMDKIIVSGTKVTNTFAPIEVLVSYRDKTEGSYKGNCEILDFADTKNGKRVMEIGTDDSDDYYPSFVANWSPENLSINA
jgi:hypothetical protein